MTYKDIINLLKGKKKDAILPDVEGNIESFNHAMGTGDIPGTGIAMAEDVRNDVPVADDIFLAIQKQFPVTEHPQKGASYILPDGKFLSPVRAHSEVDEFITTAFPQIKLEDYPNSYMVDSVGCVRLNDGQENSFKWDRYITLPPYISSEQVSSIEDWLKEYPHNSITVSDTKGHVAEFDLTDGISYLMNRIRKFKNTQILSEGKRMRKTYSQLNEEELPDIHEEEVIDQEDSGISSLLIDAINDCWTGIDHYHSIVVTLDSLGRHEFDDVLKEILEDRNKEVGKLQGLLELLSPSGPQIEQGKDEAQDQVAFDAVEEELELNESPSFTYTGEPELTLNQMNYMRPKKNPYKYSVDDLEKGDIVVIQRQPKLTAKSILLPVNVFGTYTYGPHTFSGGQERGGECDISWVVYKAKSWADAENWIERHKDYTAKELRDVIKTEALTSRKTYSELTESKKMSLKEAWASNGSLEDFEPQDLVTKAFENKHATNSVREYKDKLLYINVDPNFVFGTRNATDKIWIDVVEIEKDTNEQRRILLDSAQSEDDAAVLLALWKDEYMNPKEENDIAEDSVEISGEEDLIDGNEEI